MFMVQCSAKDTDVSIPVANGISPEDNLVGNQSDGIVLHHIMRIQCGDVEAAVTHNHSCEVDLTEVASQPQVARTPCLHIVHEAPAERLQELQSCVPGTNGQIDLMSCRRHEAFDERLCLIRFIGMGIDIDLLVLLVPVHRCIERSHPSFLEAELAYRQVSVGLGMMEDRLDASLTRGFAAEFHRMEVHEIQDVVHVHIL